MALLSCGVYILTLAPTASLWDCGEFIATSYTLGVGHPPGAPFYQIVAHLFTLMAPTPLQVAWFSNLLSAICAGFTVTMLYWSLRLMMGDKPTASSHIAAVCGSLCYLFSDTAWFSAVESEVYAPAMFLAAVMVWVALRYHTSHSPYASRWLMLLSLLVGLSICVHLMALLVLPAVIVIIAAKGSLSVSQWFRLLPQRFLYGLRHRKEVVILCVIFLSVGLTPYLIVPLRAASTPAINIGNPSTTSAFMSYVHRDQYPHAPLYPRMWRHTGLSDEYARPWSLGDTSFVGNGIYFVSYQLGYMYLRYLAWNVVGRYDAWQGYGGLQHGQIATGISPLDSLIVGSSSRAPASLPGGHHVYYLLPLLLGIIGIVFGLSRCHTCRWSIWLLFLFGGIVLSVYLNHPTYEPRERDYVYIISFYAFFMWVGVGAQVVAQWFERVGKRMSVAVAVVMLVVPMLMAVQNWHDHDRSHNHFAPDIATSILSSCHPGGILFTFGDNDTFPIWYLQQVEGRYKDVEVHNINLMGSAWSTMQMIDDNDGLRPIFFTTYARDALSKRLGNRMRQEGCVYRLVERGSDTIDAQASFRIMMQQPIWHINADSFIGESAMRFLCQYWQDVLTVDYALLREGDTISATHLLVKTMGELPPKCLTDITLQYHILRATYDAGLQREGDQLRQSLLTAVNQQRHFYATHTLRTINILQPQISEVDDIYRQLQFLP